ncbi:MAG: membrane protein [Rhodanobacter sp.]
MNRLAAWLAGLLFGAGLAWSGMADPHKVLGFLDVAGAWDPSLLLVMAGATLTYAIGWRLVMRRERPWLDTRFHVPVNRRIDKRLLVGAVLFGLGWGLGGYCPGPALAGVGLGNADLLWLLPAMLLGWWLARRWSH